MDKYEYKMKLEQIKKLMESGKYKEAAKIADGINWRKVKSVSTLCMVGELYEKTKQLEESREILLMAYDRSPVGRNIICRLTNVALKMNNLEEAQEYYEEFLEIAPHDNMKYVLQYEIARYKGVALTELIPILEELKEREFTEEWAFELAYLYHKTGNAEKCVEICDELILWFGEGKYVEKALELKMLYQPLNKLQEDKYRRLKQKQEGVVEVSPTDELMSGEIVRETVKIPNIQADAGRFNTINLQEELAKGMQKIMEAKEQETVSDTISNMKKMVGDVPGTLGTKPQEEPGKGTERNEVKQEEAPQKEDRKPDTGVGLKEIFAEEYDGQISLRVPEAAGKDPQITGQMSIDDILAEWEKTKEAARAAIEEAEQRHLEDTKARALQEAETIMERLAGELPVEEPSDADPAAPGKPSMQEKITEEAARYEKEEYEAEEKMSALEKLVAEEMGDLSKETAQEIPPQEKLNEEQKEIFTYFALIGGMEEQLCQALDGVRKQKAGVTTSESGNLVIMGEKGSGKTALATDMIKAYQKMTGRTGGKVGKISAAALNQKEISKLFEAVDGGYLIIERAGDLSKESVDRMSGMMEADTRGLLVILEDDRNGIEKVLSRSPEFSGKFTERIKIPVFTSDELVAFARAYAKEQECEIEDMGILALYNCISNIQKLDEATTLTEVKEIMDEAIHRARRGGLKKLFGAKRTADGFVLIREKDFDVY